MSLIATAGASDADSYASTTDTDAYFLARGNAAWAAAITAVKETSLRKATAYLDNQYRTRWIGIRATQAQSLAWPRAGGSRSPFYQVASTLPLVDVDGFTIAVDTVPLQVQRATMEAALLALGGETLEPVVSRDDIQIKSESKQVGPLRKETSYGNTVAVYPRYTVIEGLLHGLVTSTPGAFSGNAPIMRG